jgi:hypothetical protein
MPVRSIKQSCTLDENILALLDTFRQMTNDCIKIGLEYNASTLKRLCKLCYPALAKYHIIS